MEKIIKRTFKYTDVQRLDPKDGKYTPVGEPIREYEGMEHAREPEYVYAAVGTGTETKCITMAQFLEAALENEMEEEQDE